MSNNPSRTSTSVGVRLENELLAQLDELAERLEESRTAVARKALALGLEQLQAQLDGRSSSAPEVAAAEPEFSVYKPFAQAVLDCARRCKTGRFGEDRLFISHAWRQYIRDLGIKMSLESFKEKLLEANRERHLSLVRADMAPVLDQADVQASETRYLSATFHFLCI